MIRLLVLDLDGTMLRPDGSVSEEDAREVRRIHKAGTAVAVATGRVRQSFQYVVEAFGFEPYVICANGSYVSAPGEPPVVDKTLPPEVVAPLLREIVKRGVYAHIFTGDGEVVTPAEKYPGTTSSKIIHVQDVAAYVEAQNSVTRKITCKGPADQIPGIRDWLRSNWGDTLSVSQTGPNSAEAMPAGCSKHKGLMLVMEMLGVDAGDAMAIGDAENDAELLTAVGYPVAMGNATPDVKKIARYITASNGEGGVAKAIAHFREAGLLGD